MFTIRGMRKAVNLAALVGIAILGAVAYVGWSATTLGASASASFATVRIPEREYTARVDVARTREERIRGLSGREELLAGTGMLFLFGMLDQHHIWMRDMRFSIDIIWIAGGVVVDTHERLPVPAPGTPLEQLPYFNPRPQALLAIEVPAGTVQQYGIAPGQRVDIVFDEGKGS
ncbi:MAG: DUF192 domain-containing protein [bacterium]|nr:DUF192 domain-containing protein [bacterium]